MRKPRRATAATRRASPSRVVLALVVALLGGTEQIIASVHEASVRHVICAEHGEITHVSASAGASAPAARATVVEGSSSSEEHEHCLQAALQSPRQSPPIVSQGVAPALVASALGEPAQYTAPGTRILLSAPKTSPPRA